MLFLLVTVVSKN